MNVLATVLLLASTSSPYSASAGYSVEASPLPRSAYSVEAGTPTQPVGRFRLLMISLNGCGGCIQVENIAKGPEARAKGWTFGYNRKFDIQITKDPDIADWYKVEYFPTMILLDPAGREAGRVAPSIDKPWNAAEFFALCTQLYNRCKASKESPKPAAPSGNRSLASRYPLRSSWTWWTGCNYWGHMLDGKHAGKFNAEWLKSLSFEELQSLHSDDHDDVVQWSYVNL